MPVADQQQPVVRQRRASTVQCAQWTIEVPRVRSSNDVMGVPAVKQRRVSNTTQTARDVGHTARTGKTAGERASVRERGRQFEMDVGVPRLSTLEALRATPGDRQTEGLEGEAQNKRRKQERDPDSQIPVHFSLCDDSSDLEAKSMGDSAVLDVSKKVRRRTPRGTQQEAG